MVQKEPLIDHILELRKRLLVSFISFIALTALSFSFSGTVLETILEDILPADVSPITIAPLELILAQIKLAFFLGIVLSSPILIYQAVSFLSPGLSQGERRGILMILPAAMILFLMGIAFGYSIFIRILFYMVASLSEIPAMWTVHNIIGFILLWSLGFGLLFQTPIVITMFDRLGILPRKVIASRRAYLYVGVFIFAAIITPGDIFTQIALAIPFIAICELTILFLYITE